jgi:hypothetical protein
MAWSQSDIDTLKAAIGSGILHVAYSDRTITYKSNADQLQALALMEREVNPTTSIPYRVAGTSKGV